ncbi:hypothetical protein [Nocardiopsis sp. CC223A]|uniref:hypothetical protein n=1 Tax=Nocardiopsis sp. CC223A TaxID=3044051 RepID=UPI00278C8F06|nr:hypothetical protein [Nocardiopsis sp. CC223A]
MDLERSAPEAVFREPMDLPWRGDTAGGADPVAEFPFARPGATRRPEGREAVPAYTAGVPEVFECGGKPETVSRRTTDPARTVIETDLRARAGATGGPYERRYVVVPDAAEVRVTSYRDHRDPLVAQAAGVGV